MPWVEGAELGDWVGAMLEKGNLHYVDDLAHNWRLLMKDMSTLGIAHGDLHHRNVMIDSTGMIRLPDPDSRFVPGLEHEANSEVGVKNFQHPDYHFDRTTKALQKSPRPFDARMDHFSSLVIYTSLKALAHDPSLWKLKPDTRTGVAIHDDETLIFDGARDFVDPDASPLFQRLEQSPSLAVRELAKRLKHYAKGRPEAVPDLEQAIQGVEGL